MFWFKKIPGLSLVLLLLTYGVFGWSYTSWGTTLIEEGNLFNKLETNLKYEIRNRRF